MEVYERAGLMQRVVRRTAATRPMAKIYGRIQQPLDRWVNRATRGRTTLSAWLSGVSVVMLTTTGSRTGLPRTAPVVGMIDGNRVIVIASNFGRPRNPAWYYNLRAHTRATVHVRGVAREVEARELSPDEGEPYFRLASRIYPGFPKYREWAPDRRIPVISLDPASEG